jgi:hypothetical protein
MRSHERVDLRGYEVAGHKNYLKVFASPEAAELWLVDNDPEGVAFEYD